MLLNVPTGTSCFFGTIAVSTTSPARRKNFTWLPRWLTSTNPAASSRRLISLKGRGLSRPNLYLDGATLWPSRGMRRIEMKLQRFFQVRQRLLFGLTLAGDVNFQTLRDIPTAFAPHRRRKWPLHDPILPQNRRHCLGQNRAGSPRSVCR